MAAPTYTIAQIIQDNKQRAEGHFFDPRAVKMFNSIVESSVIQGPGGVYFITSERMELTMRKEYKIRRYVPETGRIKTELNSGLTPFTSLEDALFKTRALADLPEVPESAR